MMIPHGDDTFTVFPKMHFPKLSPFLKIRGEDSVVFVTLVVTNIWPREAANAEQIGANLGYMSFVDNIAATLTLLAPHLKEALLHFSC